MRLLLLSQDTLELRATGGFIGSFGVLRFSHGTARLEDFRATEDLALSPQCGFASTLIGNPLTPDEQRRKLDLVVSTAREVWG